MNFDETFAFIARLPSFATPEEVGGAFADMIAPSGFFAVSCGCAQDTPTGMTWKFFFNTWPPQWLSIYQQRDYVRHDPGPTAARLTSRPHTWHEILQGRELTPKQREFVDWIRDIGIVDGLGVPIHEPGGDVGLCISLADHLIEDPQESLTLQMASFHAYQRCRELGGSFVASSSKAPLTARELDCLRWVARGKSDREIGAILDISHTTVHFHIERIKRKLGVKTRTQAAGIIAAQGYI